MELILKAVLLSAVCAAGGLLLKKNNPELSILLVIATCCIVLYLAFGVINDIVDFIKELSKTAGLAPAAISVVLKTVGISIAAKFASDVCKDAGQSAAATSVEFLGSTAALYAALPLIKTVLSQISSLI